MAKRSKARHRLPGRRDTTQVGQRTVEMVDTAGTAHFLTIDAAVDGQAQGRGRYTTICHEEIESAALVARRARYCRLCAPIPTQRSRNR